MNEIAAAVNQIATQASASASLSTAIWGAFGTLLTLLVGLIWKSLVDRGHQTKTEEMLERNTRMTAHTAKRVDDLSLSRQDIHRKLDDLRDDLERAANGQSEVEREIAEALWKEARESANWMDEITEDEWRRGSDFLARLLEEIVRILRHFHITRRTGEG